MARNWKAMSTFCVTIRCFQIFFEFAKYILTPLAYPTKQNQSFSL
jgi:hypothetical protein